MHVKRLKIKVLFIIQLLLFVSAKMHAQSIEKLKVNYPYLLYLPKQYDSLKDNWPLLIYLHGGSQKGNDLNKLKAYGPPSLVDKGKNFDFIIASPQCPDGKFWSTDNWFDYLYNELVLKYHVDTSRIYISGISMGGYGAFITAMDFPEKFAAIIPLCGGCNDSDTSRICSISAIPIWAFHGTADETVRIDETKRIVNKLQQCNGNIAFTPLENEGHGIQFIYERTDIYDWMLKQNRNKSK